MTDRIRLDDLTSDQLDALYNERDQLRQQLAEADEAWREQAEHNDQTCEAVARAEAAEVEQDGAYRERAHLVALLAAMTTGAVIAPAPDVDEPGWQIAYLTIGGRQVSWHIAPRDAELFAHVRHVPDDDPRACWDGHTTEQKYARIAAHAAKLAKHCGPSHVQIAVQPAPAHLTDAIRDTSRHSGPPNRQP